METNTGAFEIVRTKSFQSCPTFCDPTAVVRQAPLSMGFSRQRSRSGLPFSPPGDLADPGIELESLMFPVLAGILYH